MSDDMKGTVIVYTIGECDRCDAAKSLLSKLRIPYTDISLDIFPECREEMERLCQRSDPPQIFFNNVHIGNEEDLEALVMDDVCRFDSLMEMLRNEESPSDAPSLPEPKTSFDYSNSSNNYEDSNQQQPSNEKKSNCVRHFVPNEYSRLVTGMKKANIIKDNRVGSIVYRNSFKGEHFINWIMQKRNIKLKDALEIGQELIERHFGRQMSKESGDIFSPERYYQIGSDDESVALNSGLLKDPNTISAKQLNNMLIEVVEPLYQSILSKDRKTINMNALKGNEHFEKYMALCKQIQRVDIEAASSNEKLAIFVNICNIMQIHIFFKHGPPTNVWQRRKLLNSTYYVIGGELYSLQSILNGILRANRRGNNMLWEPFGAEDRRLHLALAEPQPLVHFAINLGTKSGPPIKLYTIENVIEQMRTSAKDYLSRRENLRIDVKKSTVFLPALFNWYADDFGSSKTKIIEWVISVLDTGEKRNDLMKMCTTSKTFTLDYLNFDCTSNMVGQ